MLIYQLPISVLFIVIFNNANGNAEIGNDSFGIISGEQEFQKCEKTALLCNFTPRRKRNIVSRRRQTSDQVELLKIPDLECALQVRVENRRELGKDAKSDNSESSEAVSLWRDKGNISCVICDASFRNDKDYTNHCVETHGNFHPYRCPHCECKFKWKHNLKRHVDQKHDATANPTSRWISNVITCEICGERKENWLAFQDHALSKHKNERMIACSYCPKKYFRRNALLKHVKKKHKGGDNDEGEDKYKLFRKRHVQLMDCVNERQSYCHRRKPSKHLEQIGNIEVKIENEDDVPKFPGNAMSTATSQGREHIRNDSSNHDGMAASGKRKRSRRIYTCSHCNLDVIGLVEYEKHGKKMHEGLPLFHCEKCQKGFFHRNTIMSHYKEKHGNDKVKCRHCSKCYSSLGALQQHEYICERIARNEALHKERGLPFYKCDICKREFYTKLKSFQKHLRRHEEFVYCHICKKGFRKSNSQALAEHIRVRHPLLENIDALLQMAAEVKVKCENSGQD